MLLNVRKGGGGGGGVICLRHNDANFLQFGQAPLANKGNDVLNYVINA